MLPALTLAFSVREREQLVETPGGLALELLKPGFANPALDSY